MLVSLIVNGLIIGNMALYIQERNMKNFEFQTKMDTIFTAMNNLKLSNELRREIAEYIINTDVPSNL